MASTSALSLSSPFSGLLIPLDQVPDPVFSQKLVGEGVAIDPTEVMLLAPCDAKVVHLHSASHAITLEANENVQILLHIGLDTVQLKGEGFRPLVKIGDQVKRGQSLIEFDAEALAKKARSLISVMIVTEPAGLQIKYPDTELLYSVVKGGQNEILGLSKQAHSVTSPPQSSDHTPLVETQSAANETAKSDAVVIRLPVGMHARPAAQLVGVAKKFAGQIKLHAKDRSTNAKSVVGLLELEIGHGESVYFTAEGPNSSVAVQELATFLANLDEAPPSQHEASKAETTQTAKTSSDTSLICGVAASPGLAIGRVFQLRSEEFEFSQDGSGIEVENSRLDKALTAAANELQSLSQQVSSELNAKTGGNEGLIFTAHMELIEDPDLVRLATDAIEKGKSAAFAWDQAIRSHASRLEKLNNELMANRAADLRDVGGRVLRHLAEPRGSGKTDWPDSDVILIAEDLSPSDTVQIDRQAVLGFATTTGGATSHVAILARSLGLPALAGIETRALDIKDGTMVILDGERGEIRLNPSEEDVAKIRALQEAQRQKRHEALKTSALPALTQDGHRMEVAANIGGVADAKKAVELGCDGVGLLRTEFLFLERDTAPSEDEQYAIYQEITDTLGDRPLVIRTLDVGGDKPLKYMPLPEEENPFLGVRGVRVGLQKPEIFREQLRAILRVRASSPEQIHVMFPMIATVEEFREAKAILEDERQKLSAAPVKVGVMIEVPSAALIADALAQEVDFLSIGTNDLTQYTLAMDRGHKDLAKKADPYHPGVLKLIELTAQAGLRHGKWVGVCGGLASETSAIPLLMGLGVTELSVSIPAIPTVKATVRESNLSTSRALAQKVMTLSSASEVRKNIETDEAGV